MGKLRTIQAIESQVPRQQQQRQWLYQWHLFIFDRSKIVLRIVQSGGIEANYFASFVILKEHALAIIGEGKIEISPMEGCLLAATIAGDGYMPKPELLKNEVKSENIMSKDVSKNLQEMMIEVVKSGTGKRLSHFIKQGYVVGLKTGTAQKEIKGSMKNVAWMIGFAGRKNKKPEIAFAVTVEDSALAAEECSPIVNSVLLKYFSLNKE